MLLAGLSSPLKVVLIPDAIDAVRLRQIAAAYDDAVESASEPDIRIGRTTTRVTDFVNRGPVFDPLYIYEPLLATATSMIGFPYRLSAFHARTVHPNVPAQEMHVDLESDEHGPRLVSFIYMIDAFTEDNGATCFGETLPVPVCAPAGSLLVFDGSLLHGHGANTTARARRSLQGAFLRSPESPATDFGARMSPGTLRRLSDRARIVLGIC